VTASSQQPDPRRLLPLIVAIAGMGVLTFTLIAPALPDLADELGVSRSTIGWIQGVVAMPGIFLALFIGYVYDRAGRRTVAVASLLIFGLAGMAGFLARSFWGLVAVRAVQGIGTSGILSSGVIVIGDLFPAGSQRRRALGINSAGLTMTGMVAPILGGGLAEADPFLPFLVFGLALPLAWWARRLPGKPDGPPPHRPMRHLQETFEVLRERRKLADFLGLLPFAMFSLVVFVGLGATTTPLFLESEFGVSASGRGAIQAFLSVGSTVGSLNTARLADRTGPSRVFSIGFGLIGLGFAGVALAPVLPLVSLGLAVIGLGAGLAFPMLQDFVASAVPATYRGAAVGAFVMAVRMGQSFGPVAGSVMAENPGSRTAYALAGLATALILIGWRPIRSAAKRAEGKLADRRGPGAV
jgi:MFS family permease